VPCGGDEIEFPQIATISNLDPHSMRKSLHVSPAGCAPAGDPCRALANEGRARRAELGRARPSLPAPAEQASPAAPGQFGRLDSRARARAPAHARTRPPHPPASTRHTRVPVRPPSKFVDDVLPFRIRGLSFAWGGGLSFVCVLVVFVGVFWYCCVMAFKPDVKPIKRPKGGKRGC